MPQHPYLTCTLLAVSVALCLLCAVGVLVMRDAYQRLHFTTPVAAVVTVLVAAAVWVEDADTQARIKSVLVAVMLLSMNSLVCHVTARGLRVRERDGLAVDPGEPVTRTGRP